MPGPPTGLGGIELASGPVHSLQFLWLPRFSRRIELKFIRICLESIKINMAQSRNPEIFTREQLEATRSHGRGSYPHRIGTGKNCGAIRIQCVSKWPTRRPLASHSANIPLKSQLYFPTGRPCLFTTPLLDGYYGRRPCRSRGRPLCSPPADLRWATDTGDSQGVQICWRWARRLNPSAPTRHTGTTVASTAPF